MLLNLLLGKYMIFLLTLFRVAGIIMFAPLLGSPVIPRKVKIGLAVLVAIVVFPTVTLPAAAMPQTIDQFVAIVFKEAVIGLLIGFVAGMVFAGIQLAGQMIGLQIGFAIANVLNPLTDSEESVVSQFYFMMALAIFVVLNGPGLLVKSIGLSFQDIPVGALVLDESIVEAVIISTQSIFVTGLRVAAPMVVALFMVLVGMGFIARTVPQFNILVVGFSLNIIVGLLMMVVSLSTVAWVIRDALWEMVTLEVPNLITLLRGG